MPATAAALADRALLFWQLALRSRHGHFGQLLGLRPTQLGGSLELRGASESSSLAAVRVPAWCCDARDGRVRLSALVALLDEVSTFYGTVLWDRTMRPGVSIQLSARAVRPLHLAAGHTALIETRLQKIGKTLGFVAVTVTDAAGQELVRARHIKFMPMGRAFDLLFAPAWQRCAVDLAGRLLGRRPLRLAAQPDTVDQLFPFSPASSSALDIVIGPDHGNPVGSLHGGCGVMMTAHAAQLALAADSARPLLIQTNLLAGIATTKKLPARLTTELYPKSDDEPVHSRTLLSSSDGLAIETDIWWQ